MLAVSPFSSLYRQDRRHILETVHGPVPWCKEASIDEFRRRSNGQPRAYLRNKNIFWGFHQYFFSPGSLGQFENIVPRSVHVSGPGFTLWVQGKGPCPRFRHILNRRARMPHRDRSLKEKSLRRCDSERVLRYIMLNCIRSSDSPTFLCLLKSIFEDTLTCTHQACTLHHPPREMALPSAHL